MAGRFSPSNRPLRPGAYWRFVATEPERVQVNPGSVVAVPIVHTWGPLKQSVLCTSYDDFQAIFGRDASPGARAVKQCFRGEGTTDGAGAGAVLVYRMGTATAAPATVTAKNTTPADALTLSARYSGTRGNKLRYAVEPSVDEGRNDLVIYDDTVEVERYTHDEEAIQALADEVNGLSDWVTADALVPDVALAPIAATPLVGGADGDTLLTADLTSALTALEPERFSILSFYDLTDAAARTAVQTWAQTRNEKGKRVELVVGGPLDEAVGTAIADAAAIDDPNIIRVSVGSVTDEEFGVLSTSQLAPRIAGILAARGDSGSITYARLAGLTLTKGASDADVDKALVSGLVVLGTDSRQDAPVHVIKGLTTYTTQSDADRPYSVYRNPKFVRTMQLMELDFTEYLEGQRLGRVVINDQTKGQLVSDFGDFLRAREIRGAINPGWRVEIDPSVPAADTDEWVNLRYEITFGRTLEQAFGTIAVR